MCLDPISRRRFLQFTAAGVAGSASVAEAQTPAPARPQDQMTAGMIDFHVHTYPDNFDRTVGAVEAAQGARERGLKAIVLKGGARSEERRVGKECFVPCRSRWWPDHLKKKKQKKKKKQNKMKEKNTKTRKEESNN